MNLTELSLSKLSEGISRGTFSAVEVLQEFLKNIDKREADLNAFIAVEAEGALKAAKKVKKGQNWR